jgi:serine phosphatase RsbU (regulator of sigma subunit)
MLSGTLPAAPGLELDVAYRPGVTGLEIGGDWYDAFWLDEADTVGLVVGDVVGRGIAAAATMGQLRSAVRALASTGLGPGRLLDALDGYARRHGVGQMATLVYAELGLRSRSLRYACAGHPPAVVVSPGEPPGFMSGGRSVPLDAHFASAGPRAEDARTLAPGSTVVLYTDGLIEQRSRPLADGMERLLREIAVHRDEPPTVLAGAVVRALHQSEHSDDVCLLAARVSRP